MGRDPFSWWLKEGELAIWETWNRVASAYAVDHERVSIMGTSMGAYGTFRLAFNYPHLFAAAAAVAPPTKCATIEVVPGAVDVEIRTINDDDTGICFADGDTGPLVENARYVPFAVFNGGADEVVPPQAIEAQVRRFDDLGYRYTHQFHPIEGHTAYVLVRDGFSDLAVALDGRRTTRAARVAYTWYSNAFKPALGVGPSGAYWLSGLVSRDFAPGLRSRVAAHSEALAEPDPTPVRSTRVEPFADPSPAVVRTLAWAAAPAPQRRAVLTAKLTNVGTATVDMVGAGFVPGEPAALRFETDGPTQFVLTGTAPGTVVENANGSIAVSDANGRATFTLPAGSHDLTLA